MEKKKQTIKIYIVYYVCVVVWKGIVGKNNEYKENIILENFIVCSIKPDKSYKKKKRREKMSQPNLNYYCLVLLE